MSRPELRLEFARRVYRWIDISPESLLSTRQRADYVLEVRFPHDKQVDIAVRSQLAPSGGSEHESDEDLASKHG
jgi:hypothetical protein